MKKVLLGCFVLVLVLVVAFLGITYVLPASFEVTRSTTIEATPEEVHAVVGDLSRFREWTIWHEDLPDIEYRISEPATGADAQIAWDSEQSHGSMTITASDPARGVWFDTSMESAFEMKDAITWELAGDGQVRVTWSERGDLGGNPVHRWFGLGMDSFVGPMFERNLAKLKSLLESEAPPTAPAESAPPAEEPAGATGPAGRDE